MCLCIAIRACCVFRVLHCFPGATWYIRLSGTFAEIDIDQVEDFEKHIKRLLKPYGVTVELTGAGLGSVILYFSSSLDAFDLFVQVWKSGMLRLLGQEQAK